MKNLIINEYRKQMPGKELNRTRPYIDFKCYRCSTLTTISSAAYEENKPCASCQKTLAGERKFFEVVNERYKGQLDFSKVIYVNPTSKVEVTCIKHNHSYFIAPVELRAKPRPNKPAKGGCSKCATEATKEYLHKPIEHYLQALALRFPQFSVKQHGTAETNKEPILLYCEYHGDFVKTLHSLTSKTSVHLCPGCNNALGAWNTRSARTDVEGKVYFVYLPKVSLYKFGVTYRDLRKRLREFKQQAELVWSIDFKTLSDAYFFEYNFFRYHKHIRYKGERAIPVGGYTELFTSLINKPTKRFVEEILRLKESNSGKLPTHSGVDNPERSLERGTCND